ncbi:MAG TPA: LysM domain-containing protein [Solirubrobacteraceae bacterium]|jgi:LysM repeat protein|nr:LysM domain-containing protein [Solirubrobacteraceae bacterium]
MTSHRPSRWLAPLALLAAMAAVFAVVSTTIGDGEGGEGPAATTAQKRDGARTGRGSNGETTGGGTTTGPRTTPQRRTYTVRPGDTLARISERTGVSVEELQELNPDIDPNSLTVGDKIKLTE